MIKKNHRGPGTGKVRVWLSEAQEKLRWRKIQTIVVDCSLSTQTGKAERYFFELYENGLGARRVNVNGSLEAYEYQSWQSTWFFDIARRWEMKQMSYEELIEMTDKELISESDKAIYVRL